MVMRVIHVEEGLLIVECTTIMVVARVSIVDLVVMILDVEVLLYRPMGMYTGQSHLCLNRNFRCLCLWMLKLQG